MTPGQLLREARRRHGVTQEQLAARARTSQAAISRVERDVVSPSVSTLATLLDLLGEELELASTPIDYGHDPTLIDVNLEHSPAERVRRQAEWSRGMESIQNPAGPEPRFDSPAMLEALGSADVDFVLIGGVAAGAHGSAYGTPGLDIALSNSPANFTRMAKALGDLECDQPFSTPEFVGLTRYGHLRSFTAPYGAPTYQNLAHAAQQIEIGSVRARVAALDHLIAMKEAGPRTRDRLLGTEYRVISDELRAPRDG